jgi:transcription termination factor NusB
MRSKVLSGMILTLVLTLTGFSVVCIAVEEGNVSLSAVQESMNRSKAEWTKFMQLTEKLIDRFKSHELTPEKVDNETNTFLTDVEVYVEMFKPTGDVSVSIDKLIQRLEDRIKEMEKIPENKKSVEYSKNLLEGTRKRKLELGELIKGIGDQLERVSKMKKVVIARLEDGDLGATVEQLNKSLEETQTFSANLTKSVDKWFEETEAQITKQQTIPQ